MVYSSDDQLVPSDAGKVESMVDGAEGIEENMVFGLYQEDDLYMAWKMERLVC